jgi:hypothetical protein
MASGDLVAGRTEREIEASRQEQAIEFSKRVRMTRENVTSELKPGWALDREHVAALLAGGTAGARGYHMTRHFLVLGLLAAGWSTPEIAIACNMPEDEVRPESERNVYVQLDGDLMDQLDEAHLAVFARRSRPVEQWRR